MTDLVHSIRLEYGDALFRLYQFQITPVGDPATQAMHEHQFYELHLALRGDHSYVLDTAQIPVRQEQMLLIPIL